MKHHIFPLLFISLLVCFAADPAAAQLSLRALASASLEHSSALRSANLQHQAHRAGVRGAYGRLLPEISVDVLYTHMNDDLVLDLDPIRSVMIQLQSDNAVTHADLVSLLSQGRALTEPERSAASAQARAALESAVPHFTETLKEQTFLQGAVSLRQPLFTGGKILAGIRAAQAIERAGQEEVAASRDAVLAETTHRYLDVLLAQENLKVRRSALASITRHAQRAEALLAQGVIAQPDRSRANIALSEARRNVFEADQRCAIARTALASVTGVAGDQLSLADSLRYLHSDFPLEDLLSTAQAGNHSLQRLQLSSEALSEKANARFADYFPTVYGFGMINLFEHYMVEKAEPHWAVGIGASFTLFDGLRRSSEHQEARRQAEALQETAVEAQRNIDLLLRKTWMEMRLAEQQFLSLDSDMTAAEENLRLYEKRFSEGLSTSLDVIDAQVRLESIALGRAAALRDMYASLLSATALSGHIQHFFSSWDDAQKR
jgi:outer membrane protein TolC